MTIPAPPAWPVSVRDPTDIVPLYGQSLRRNQWRAKEEGGPQAHPYHTPPDTPRILWYDGQRYKIEAALASSRWHTVHLRAVLRTVGLVANNRGTYILNALCGASSFGLSAISSVWVFTGSRWYDKHLDLVAYFMPENAVFAYGYPVVSLHHEPPY